MKKNNLSLPESACAYEHYDPETLKPSNDSTYIRLMELGWQADEFAGKTVLDIGTNTGLLSLYAHQLGATRVHATDVQEPLLDFFSAVVERHRLPITVERCGFDMLDPSQHAADIVCLMEVLHWLVDQGMTVSYSIAHVSALTRETLYLETPWDIREPSIARKGILREDQYNMELILRELKLHFSDVSIVRFMTYFGTMPDSKRVLVRASGRRSLTPSLWHLREANFLDISMVRGPNQVELVTTPLGPKVLKRLPPDSVLSRLDDASFEALCVHFSELRNPTLVPPERLGTSFRNIGEDRRVYMLFPFVGRLSNYFPERGIPEAVSDSLKLAIALRDDLNSIPCPLVEKIRANCNPIPPVHIDSVPGKAAKTVAQGDIGDLCRRAALSIANYDRMREDTVCHSDMQTGNMVVTPMGDARVIDLDLIRTGTPFSDVLSCAIYNGASANDLQNAIERLSSKEKRPLEQFDIDFSVAQSVAWLQERTAQKPPMTKTDLGNYIAGLCAVAQVMSKL